MYGKPGRSVGLRNLTPLGLRTPNYLDVTGRSEFVTPSARFALDKNQCRTPGLSSAECDQIAPEVSLSRSLRAASASHEPVPLVDQKRQDLRDRGDAWALPVTHLVPRRLLVRTMNENRLHADPLRAGELVVGAVAHE